MLHHNMCGDGNVRSTAYLRHAGYLSGYSNLRRGGDVWRCTNLRGHPNMRWRSLVRPGHDVSRPTHLQQPDLCSHSDVSGDRIVRWHNNMPWHKHLPESTDMYRRWHMCR